MYSFLFLEQEDANNPSLHMVRKKQCGDLLKGFLKMHIWDFFCCLIVYFNFFLDVGTSYNLGISCIF